MTFSYLRTVYLADTDAAGVIFFARGMELCHEAYEEWLASIGMSISKLLQEKKLALPIVHGEIDFFRPIFCGDKLQIVLESEQVNDTEFAIAYQFSLLSNPNKIVIKAKTTHVCINPVTRVRTSLPSNIIQSF